MCVKVAGSSLRLGVTVAPIWEGPVSGIVLPRATFWSADERDTMQE